jgi:hypothetical protein
MSGLLPVVAAFLSLLTPQYGGMDMAAAQKWDAAKVVAYRVEGVHNARASVVLGDYEGKADVFDRVTVEFTWDAKKRKVVGPVTVKDGKTVLKNIRSDGTNCPPPQLLGEYEHFQSASNSQTAPDQIQIKGTRTYPPAKVSNYPGSCSMRSIPGGTEEASLWLAVADPGSLALPIMKDGPIVVAADRKSFAVKGAENWVWTYFPTLLK